MPLYGDNSNKDNITVMISVCISIFDRGTVIF